MADPIKYSEITKDPARLRGISSGVWKRASTADQDLGRSLIRSGATTELMTEVLAEKIAIKDQHLRVNPDHNDPNPASPINRPSPR